MDPWLTCHGYILMKIPKYRKADPKALRNMFDFWNNLVLNYSWEPVPMAQLFLGSMHLWKVIRHEKCQFSPTSLRAWTNV